MVKSSYGALTMTLCVSVRSSQHKNTDGIDQEGLNQIPSGCSNLSVHLQSRQDSNNVGIPPYFMIAMPTLGYPTVSPLSGNELDDLKLQQVPQQGMILVSLTYDV